MLRQANTPDNEKDYEKENLYCERMQSRCGWVGSEMVAGCSGEAVQPQSEDVLECNQETSEQQSNGGRANCAFQLPALQKQQAASLVCVLYPQRYDPRLV